MTKRRRRRYWESAYMQRVRKVIDAVPNPTLDELLAHGRELFARWHPVSGDTVLPAPEEPSEDAEADHDD